MSCFIVSKSNECRTVQLTRVYWLRFNDFKTPSRWILSLALLDDSVELGSELLRLLRRRLRAPGIRMVARRS